MFKSINPNVSFPELEEEQVKYWREAKIFEKSVEKDYGGKKWTFLDGPPFITGLPHYGSLLSSLPKDVYPRFWTMKGYKVRRVWGWDCHGLPAENKVEEKLGIKRKRDIEEKVGIKKFIDECKLYVSEVSSEWEWYIDHIGRWVDFKNAYRTMDKDYMESVMWVFKSLYDKGYIYKGLRVSLFCPHCSTPISNFEVAMDNSYKDIEESAETYKYELRTQNGDGKTFLLAWSTTPWNKIVTPALAVNPKLTYVKVKPHSAEASRGKQGEEFYILAKARIEMLKDEPYEVVDEIKGEDLVGAEFVPHYDFYKIEKGKKAFIVIGGDFVSEDEGTGIVTLAAYGEEDLEAMKKENIQIVQHVNEEGIINSDVPKLGGLFYLDASAKVNEDLEKRGLLYNSTPYSHSVPTCWRCHTRLFYNPQDAWYVDIKKLRPKLIKNNEMVNWFPKHFKYGRFIKSMKAAPDWCISRSRYWGSPVPVWECKCGERVVTGSIKEIEELSGIRVKDLHKPEIDEVQITCKKCGQKAKRVKEVLDSWIEAGSASFAERHYPFSKKEKLEDFFPPDFIAEYTGQIRAWFYVLHVISTGLFDSKAFKNVLVEGVILGTDGRKMSKNYGNYPDPKEMLGKYGGDALRLYLLGSNVMHGEDIRISEEEYRDQVKGTLLILWNIFNFFITNANTLEWRKEKDLNSDNILDKWIISKTFRLRNSVTDAFENFDTVGAIKNIKDFINEFSTWYIRRSRERLYSEGKDANDFFSTAYTVLVELSKLMAPVTPFIAEKIYRNLTDEESVHLASWSGERNDLINEGLEENMSLVRQVVEAGHFERKRAGIKLRQPLNLLTVRMQGKLDRAFLDITAQELNVKNVELTEKEGEMEIEINTEITADLKEEGEARELIRKIQQERKKLGTKRDEYVTAFLPIWPKKFEDEIKRRAYVKAIEKSEEFEIKRSDANE